MNSTEQPKILIIRLSSIGDIIQASAVPRHLKMKFPTSTIDWVIRSDNKELLNNNPYVTQTIAFNRKVGFSGWLKLCERLKLENYTHVYDAHNNLRSHILCLYLKPKYFIRRSKERIRRFLIFWLKLKFLNNYASGIETYLNPLKKWGISNDQKGSELYVDNHLLSKVKPLLNFTSNIIAIMPATAWPKKTWPAENWKRLIEEILSQTKLNILILAGPKDDFCKDLVLNSARVQSLQGRLSLLESAAALTFCKTIVAADTGLLHMAEALGKNVLCIQGPSHLGHTFRKESITLKKNLWCQPCSKDGSGICIRFKYQKCMTDIKADEVFNSLQRLI
ncbi:MAG: glycosyltransferase family 9 protein [Oligoflexia bacterium]|nr:glycosyltransferase family 9 protein [Oligoflexia bacterium]